MLKYHILNIIPHTFYRRTAIKLLNSVEQCFKNNFQTKKTWTEGLINFKKLFPLSNSCCHFLKQKVSFLLELLFPYACLMSLSFLLPFHFHLPQITFSEATHHGTFLFFSFFTPYLLGFEPRTFGYY